MSVFALNPEGVRSRLTRAASALPFACDLIEYAVADGDGVPGEGKPGAMYALVKRRHDDEYVTYLVCEHRVDFGGSYTTFFENGQYGFRRLSDAAVDLERRAGLS
jgi:hypothetical protein